ncbi:unnamed protein product, partial [Iphiclides podalirius]
MWREGGTGRGEQGKLLATETVPPRVFRSAKCRSKLVTGTERGKGIGDCEVRTAERDARFNNDTRLALRPRDFAPKRPENRVQSRAEPLPLK